MFYHNHEHLKVFTYNIHKGFSVANIRFVLHEIRDEIIKILPDVVLLQEIQGEHITRSETIDNWPNQSQFEFLAQEAWPHHTYGKNAIYREGHHGNAILSKHPILSFENIDVSENKRTSRSVLHITIAHPRYKKPIHIICIHFSLFKSGRLRQLQKLVDRIESHVPHNEPIIVGGDFNDWRKDAEDFLETHLELKEVFKHLHGHHAKTFPSWQPTLEVDRIYYRGVEAEVCRRYAQQPWQQLSDHLPLYAVFKL